MGGGVASHRAEATPRPTEEVSIFSLPFAVLVIVVSFVVGLSRYVRAERMRAMKAA